MGTPFTYIVRRILSKENFDRKSTFVPLTMLATLLKNPWILSMLGKPLVFQQRRSPKGSMLLESEPRYVPMRKGPASPVLGISKMYFNRPQSLIHIKSPSHRWAPPGYVTESLVGYKTSHRARPYSLKKNDI